MRILYITLEDLSLHKGSVTHVKEIVAGLRKRGHQVGLIGRPWNSIAFSSLFLLISLFAKLPRYDVIYARDYHTVIIALLPRLIFRKKLVFEVNGIANEEQKLKSNSMLNRIFVFLIRIAEEMATKHSENIISVTSQIGTYLVQNYHCSHNKVKVVGNGVDTIKFHPIHDEALIEIWKKKLGIEVGETVIAFVGNLAPWQGVNILIETALRLLSRNGRLKFIIVGEGLLKGTLMDGVMNSGVAGRFVFTGMVEHKDVPFLINIADICVAPFVSQRNKKTGTGSPIKIFEYMACGKPVVSSRFEGLEFIEAEGIGLLTDPGDVIGLEKALHDLINEPQKRTNMGQRATEIARENFSWESRVIEIEKVLKELA